MSIRVIDPGPIKIVASPFAISASANVTTSTIGPQGTDTAAAHAILTTGTHGVGAGSIVGTTLTQTLTNKTLTSPTLTAPVATGSLASFGGAWTAFTPTVTAQAGTFTSTSASMRYTQIGKTVMFQGTVTITTVGTAANSVNITIPVAAQAGTLGLSVGTGRESALGGKALTVTLANTGAATILNYDNSSPIAAGAVLRVSGTYEAA